MPQACPSQLSLTRTSYHHCIWIWNRKDDKIIQKQSKTKHCMVLRMKTPSFVKVNEKEKFEIQLSGKGLTNESLRTSIEELEQFLRAEGTEKRTLDLDLTHNPDVTDDSDDSDPGEAGFTSGFNFSAKAAISKGHFASFATASTEACGRGGKDFWARHWWHWPKRSARKAGEGAWTIQTIPLERCSKRNRRDPLCSCLQCQADKWGSKSAITPAGTSSSISLGAGWGRGRWEGHLELVGLGFAGEEIHWSWAERHGRLWHGVRLGFGQGGRPDRPMGQFASEVGGWEDGEIEGVGIIWNILPRSRRWRQWTGAKGSKAIHFQTDVRWHGINHGRGGRWARRADLWDRKVSLFAPFLRLTVFETTDEKTNEPILLLGMWCSRRCVHLSKKTIKALAKCDWQMIQILYLAIFFGYTLSVSLVQSINGCYCRQNIPCIKRLTIRVS